MFEQLSQLATDPILGLMAEFRADQRNPKVDLGVGVYLDEHGRTPVMRAVKAAEARLLEGEDTKTYQSIAGAPEYCQRMMEMALGELLPSVSDRLVSLQATGGCGALRLGAEVIQRARPGATVWVSTPTWVNHIPLIGGAGLTLREYPYYDPATHAVNGSAMLDALEQAGPGDVVLLHACCHNPTGADLSPAHWDAIAELALRRGFTPYVDMAYQGLGDGLAEDAYGVRKLAATVPEMLLAVSCSKNFGIYRERTGMLMLLSESTSHVAAVQSQAMAAARQIWSMPPAHGASVVSTILGDAALRADWESELAEVRQRILDMRALLADQLRDNSAGIDFSFINRQKGMFSYLGISLEQVRALRERYAVYMIDSTRVNIAGITRANVGYLGESIRAVL